VTVTSTETRDKILDSAPWLASYFLATEKAKRQTEKRKSVSDTDLRYDNPYLENLRQRYSHHPANDHTQWRTSNVEAVVDLPFFRADNLYIFQSHRYPQATGGPAATSLGILRFDSSRERSSRERWMKKEWIARKI
jgi:hypothetical protein